MGTKEEDLPDFLRAMLRTISREHSAEILKIMEEINTARKKTSNLSLQEELHTLYEDAREANLLIQENKRIFSPQEKKRRRPLLRIVR